MTRRTLILLAALAAACAPTYTDDAPESTPRTRYSGHETGTSSVGVIPDIPLRDEERNRDLMLSIDYPTRGGPHPLIVFSPAEGLSNRDYVGLSSYWAANEYVVIRLARSEAREVRFVLDSLDALERRYPELQGKIDRTRVGLAGHAEGARSVMEAAGDARVKAVVALQPGAEGPEVRLPALFVAAAPRVAPASTGATTTAAPAEAAAPPPLPEAYTRAPAGDKWAIVIENARFQSFTGRLDDVTFAQARARANEGDPYDPYNMPVQTRDGRVVTRADYAAMRQQDLFAIVRGSALAFWDTYLKNDAEARTALENVRGRRGATVERK